MTGHKRRVGESDAEYTARRRPDAAYQYAMDTDYLNARRLRWHEANRDRSCESMRKYYQNNKGRKACHLQEELNERHNSRNE